MYLQRQQLCQELTDAEQSRFTASTSSGLQAHGLLKKKLKDLYETKYCDYWEVFYIDVVTYFSDGF